MGIAERKAGLAAAFSASLTENMSSPTAAEAILKAYHITPHTEDEAAYQRILEFANDIGYHAPALAFAKSWPGKTYYYHFDEPNPWDGAFKGHSTHLLDAAFLFQGYNKKLAAEGREIATALGKGFVKFANGEAPWKAFDRDNGGLKRFGPSQESLERFVEGFGGEERRDQLFRLKEEGVVDLDEVSRAWDLLLARQ